MTSAHALLAPHVLNHEQGSKETFAFLSSRIILFSAAPSIIHSAPAAGAEHSWVTMPSSVTQLCHRHPPALSASARNPPGADCHKIGFFFLSRNAAIIFVKLQAGEASCQVPASWNAARNAAPMVPPSCSVPLPSCSQTRRFGPPKVNNSSRKVHSLTSVRSAAALRDTDSHRHTPIPACISYFCHY